MHPPGAVPLRIFDCKAVHAGYKARFSSASSVLSKGGIGEQGLCHGESTHLPPICPRFKSQHLCHMWVSLLLVLSFAPRGFSQSTPVLPSPQNPTFLNCNSTSNQGDKEPLQGCATSKSLFILFIVYLFSCLPLSTLVH